MGRGDAVEVVARAEGAGLRVRVRPGGRCDRLLAAHGGALKLEVTAPPERGKANVAVAALLARELGVARTAVAITSGASGHDKSVVVSGLGAEEVAERLARAGIAAVVRHPG
jgi:uncharacterized protein YggU (UPF0235/DUF167 family)